ncbi:LysR family transcriptional regulator [Tropicibacter sp. S64]|uniref:LysR family transcriptional regulator n=1 Tax=Tropicibacter sp. S64 TaxID=3415122 RepID=UPI003C79A755
MIKIQHIEMLLAIEQAGSIRAASKRLGKTQPAVTKALRQAEAELGAAIFKRAPTGVAVTEDGQPILHRARLVHSELRKMQEEVDQRRGLGTGRLTVIVSPLAASRLISRTIRLFRRRYPKVHIQITGGHEPMAFGPVRDGLVDLVIGPEPRGTDSTGLSTRFLVETPISVITGKSSRWLGETRLAALAEGDWTMIGTRVRLPYLQRHFTRHGIVPPEPMVTSDSLFSVLSLIEDGDFLCTFPQRLLAQVMAKWNIVALDVDPPLRAARISVTTSSERLPTPALQYFIDCVEQVSRNTFDEGDAREL